MKTNYIGQHSPYVAQHITDMVGDGFACPHPGELDRRIDRVSILSEVASKNRAISQGIADRLFGKVEEAGLSSGASNIRNPSAISRLDDVLDVLEREIRRTQEELARIDQI